MKKREEGGIEMKLTDYTTVRLLCAKCPPFVASIVMSFTFVACNATSPTAPVLPAATEEFSPDVAAPASCPTYAEACNAGIEYVASACPPVGKNKPPGQLKKCRRQTLSSYLDGVASCFTPAELDALRRCILASFPVVTTPSGGTAKDRFHSDE
jgi:hypothetical protein